MKVCNEWIAEKDGWHRVYLCGRPAKWTAKKNMGTLYLCGVHVRRYKKRPEYAIGAFS